MAVMTGIALTAQPLMNSCGCLYNKLTIELGLIDSTIFIIKDT